MATIGFLDTPKAARPVTESLTELRRGATALIGLAFVEVIGGLFAGIAMATDVHPPGTQTLVLNDSHRYLAAGVVVLVGSLIIGGLLYVIGLWARAYADEHVAELADRAQHDTAGSWRAVIKAGRQPNGSGRHTRGSVITAPQVGHSQVR